MLLQNSEYLYKWLLLYAFFAMLHVGCIYLVNRRRPAGDPRKRNYPALLIVLAPVTLPLSILVSILTFIVRALLYGLSLVAFVIGLLFATVAIVARKAWALYEK